MQRWLCQNPDCGCTFGVLPANILPICRTPHSLVQEVADRCEQGQTLPAIRRATGLSVGILKRLVPWILTTSLVLVSLARSTGILDDQLDPISVVDCLRLTRFWSRWEEFCYLFSRTRYPRRWPPDPRNLHPTIFVMP